MDKIDERRLFLSGVTKRRALHPALVCILGLLVAGCESRSVTMRASASVPTALVQPVSAGVAVFYADKLRQHEYVEQSEARGEWRIHTGDAQLAMFRRVLGDLFADLSEIDRAVATDIPLLLVPDLNRVQFATPAETGFDYYECWLEYTIEFATPNPGTYPPWRFSAYGQANKSTPGGIEGGLNAALEDALRAAGATLATQLGQQPAIKTLEQP